MDEDRFFTALRAAGRRARMRGLGRLAGFCMRGASRKKLDRAREDLLAGFAEACNEVPISRQGDKL
jgi:hypothetical protein